ncbi:MAG: CDP-alcohol phosphatidyltransferase family protein [Myxococcales bacterium]|nr:MAG: CDP-alcohol phosphatidyltransferase family protein [Myxococcales bacterium]
MGCNKSASHEVLLVGRDVPCARRPMPAGCALLWGPGATGCCPGTSAGRSRTLSGSLAGVVQRALAMAFWDAYLASLKPREVEEPIDYWLHRPLGYIVARLSDPTPLTPNLITVGSILLGWAAAACLVVEFPHHHLVGGALILASTVFDCADGQLARMRKSSSVWGRMLDGSADTLVLLAVVPVTLWRIWQRIHEPTWLGVAALALGVLSVITSGWQTLLYDYYKNAWARFTTSTYTEGETHAAARARHEAELPRMSTIQRMASWLYLVQTRSVDDIVRRFDPQGGFERIPPWSPETEAIYRRHQARPWALCRSYCGVGTLMFGLALFNAIDLPEVYLVVRLLVFHPVTWLILRPLQQRATAATNADLDALAARPAAGPQATAHP